MIHLEGVFYIIVLYHTRRALPVIHRVITPLRVVFFTPVLTHLFIRPFIGVKQLHPGPPCMNFQFSGVDPEMCVIHVWLHLEGDRGKLQQLQTFTLSPTKIREWMENFTSGDANLGVGFMFFCMFFPRSMGKWSNLTSIFFKWVGSTTN